MQFAGEIELLKLLAAGEARQLVTHVLARAVDFQTLLDFLERHELAQYFSHRLDTLHLNKLFPVAFRERLAWQRDAQRQQREALAAALCSLHREFAADGVEFILTKGLHLADQFWGGVENRFTWDLDVLVKAVAVDSAVHSLQRAGYRSAHAGALASRLVRRYSHAMEFTRQGIAVDLHWIFRPRPGHCVDYAAIWARRGSWVFRGNQYCVLGAQDTLLMLLLGIAQDVERAQPNYRKLWDIYLLLCSGVIDDWPAFMQFARAQGVGRLVVAMLAFSCYALNCTAAFPDLQRVLQHGSADAHCSAQQLRTVLARPPGHPANRLWIARLQPVSTVYYLVWWTLTAPMRYLVWR